MKRYAQRLALVKQFGFAFFALYLLAFAPTAKYLLYSSQDVTILEAGSQNTFSLTSDQAKLQPDQEFSLKISFSVTSPIHFAQALIEYDSNVLEPILPTQKLIDFPQYKELQTANRLRLSATSANPVSLILDQLQSLTGTQDLASVKFKVLKASDNGSTTISLLPTTSVNEEIDWEQSSVLATINQDNTIDSLLETTTSLTLNFASTPSPTPLLSPSPSPSPLSSPSPYVFATITDEATEIPTASEPAQPIETVSSPTPKAIPTYTAPALQASYKLPLLDRIFLFFTNLLK